MKTALVPLGEVAELRSGVGFPERLQGKSTGKYPFAKVGDISRVARSGARDLHEATHYVDEGDLKFLKAKPFPVGTVAFAKIGEAIRQDFRVIAACAMLLDNNVMGAIPGEAIDSRYLFEFLRSLKLYSYSQSTTVPSLRKSDLAQIPVPLPPIEEQRRIAAVLDAADALRAKRRQALAKLDTLTQAIFIDMFGDPLRNPRNWPRMRLGDLATKFSDGPFGSNLKSAHYVDEGIRVIRLQNIGVGQFVGEDRAFISPEHFDRLKKHTCLPGDVLVGTMGDPNLRACIQPQWLPIALNKADCVQVRPHPERACGAWLCALLNSPQTLTTAAELMTGQTRVRISMGRLRELMVPVPPLSLQKQFASRTSAAATLHDTSHRSREALDGLFASLQQRAFMGEL